MTTSRSTSRASANARAEIIGMLKEDHKRARKAFRDFEKLDPHENPEECQALVLQTCGELQVHATLEEELFYPAARSVMSEEDLIDEAEVEHMTAKQLIAQLQGMGPSDDKFAATFKVLGEYIKHHAREEEGEMFPQLARAKLDWESLAQEIDSRREELMGQFLPKAGAQDEESETRSERTGSPAAAGSRAGGARAGRAASAGSRAQAAGSEASDESDD